MPRPETGGSARISGVAFGALVDRHTKKWQSSVLEGKVYVPAGKASPLEKRDGMWIVHVRAHYRDLPLECRLAGGLWLCPPVGTDVTVLCPRGNVAGAPPVLIPSIWGGQQPGDDELAVGDAVLMAAIDGGAVKLGSAIADEPSVLGNVLYALIQKVMSHRHSAPPAGGITSSMMTASEFYDPGTDDDPIPNPAFPDPLHVHNPDDPGDHSTCPPYRAEPTGAATDFRSGAVFVAP